jgi:hypothetical protein
VSRVAKRRLTLAERVMACVPLPEALVRTAFHEFRTTGVLPDDQRIASTVTLRALCGDADPAEQAEVQDFVAAIRAELPRLMSNLPVQPKTFSLPMREYLFGEAVFGPGVIRRAARAALVDAVRNGADVTDARWLTAMPRPEVSVGLHLLGWPDQLTAVARQALGDDLEDVASLFDGQRRELSTYEPVRLLPDRMSYDEATRRMAEIIAVAQSRVAAAG